MCVYIYSEFLYALNHTSDSLGWGSCWTATTATTINNSNNNHKQPSENRDSIKFGRVPEKKSETCAIHYGLDLPFRIMYSKHAHVRTLARSSKRIYSTVSACRFGALTRIHAFVGSSNSFHCSSCFHVRRTQCASVSVIAHKFTRRENQRHFASIFFFLFCYLARNLCIRRVYSICLLLFLSMRSVWGKISSSCFSASFSLFSHLPIVTLNITLYVYRAIQNGFRLVFVRPMRVVQLAHTHTHTQYFIKNRAWNCWSCSMNK